MRFSIIIPVYNVEPYLRECLDSVLQQSYGDWEAVCVDDGSTDGSAAILTEYAARDSRFRIITQPNGGLSAARNTGLDNAQGDYILFLDSDDWLESNTLEILNTHLQPPNSDLLRPDILCFNGRYTDTLDVLTPESHLTGWEYYNRYALEHREFPFVCVVLRCYRRQLLNEKKLRFREGILHEDNHFTPRVCLAAKEVSVIPNTLYHYRRRPGSIMATRSLRSRQDMIRIANDLSEFFGKEQEIDKTIIYRSLTHHYQVAFLEATREETRHLSPLVDWHCYRRVSRTRPRHRLNYSLLRLCPYLYTMIENK